jgi:tryptophan synthase alpha chain
MAGFGISRKEHAKAVVSAGADGVITGSILSKIVEKNLDCPHKALPEIARIAREIKQGCKEGYMEKLVK